MVGVVRVVRVTREDIRVYILITQIDNADRIFRHGRVGEGVGVLNGWYFEGVGICIAP